MKKGRRERRRDEGGRKERRAKEEKKGKGRRESYSSQLFAFTLGGRTERELLSLISYS